MAARRDAYNTAARVPTATEYDAFNRRSPNSAAAAAAAVAAHYSTLVKTAVILCCVFGMCC